MNGFVRIDETAFKIMNGSEVMYLTDMWFTKHLADRYVDFVQTEPTQRFYAFVANQVNTMLSGGEVAAEIEPVIMNLVDDKMNHRKMGLRTGDYITLQRFFRAQG